MKSNSKKILTYSKIEDLSNKINKENSNDFEPFIYQNIKYSDKRVVEKLEKIENIKRKINAKEVKGKLAYMSLFI